MAAHDSYHCHHHQVGAQIFTRVAKAAPTHHCLVVEWAHAHASLLLQSGQGTLAHAPRLLYS